MKMNTRYLQIVNLIFFIFYWLRASSYAQSGDVSRTILYVGLGIMTCILLIKTAKGD